MSDSAIRMVCMTVALVAVVVLVSLVLVFSDSPGQTLTTIFGAVTSIYAAYRVEHVIADNKTTNQNIETKITDALQPDAPLGK